MKIKSDTQVSEIIMSHEKRIGNFEILFWGYLAFKCLQSFLRVVAEKCNNVLIMVDRFSKEEKEREK